MKNLVIDMEDKICNRETLYVQFGRSDVEDVMENK